MEEENDHVGNNFSFSKKFSPSTLSEDINQTIGTQTLQNGVTLLANGFDCNVNWEAPDLSQVNV